MSVTVSVSRKVRLSSSVGALQCLDVESRVEDWRIEVAIHRPPFGFAVGTSSAIPIVKVHTCHVLSTARLSRHAHAPGPASRPPRH